MVSASSSTIYVQSVEHPQLGCLIYTLLEDTIPCCGIQYSISIEQKTAGSYSAEIARFLTSNKTFAMEIFHMLCRGTVTPSALCEVVQELLP